MNMNIVEHSKMQGKLNHKTTGETKTNRIEAKNRNLEGRQGMVPNVRKGMERRERHGLNRNGLTRRERKGRTRKGKRRKGWEGTRKQRKIN